MDQLTNAYIAHIESVFDELGKKLTGGLGLDYANKQ
jgi:hypothetical protein